MTDKNNDQHWKVLVLILRKISESKGISQQEIADRTGLQRSNISRLFNLQYCPNMRTFITIAKAIEVNFFFEDKGGKTDLSQIFEAAMTELGRNPEQLNKN